MSRHTRDDPPRRARRRGMTVLEVVVALAVFSMIMLTVAGLVRTGMDTSNLVGEQTRAQVEAERIVRAVREQLSRSGSTPNGGNLVYTAFPATNSWEIAYNKLGTDPLTAPVGPADLAPLWDTTRYVIKWEHPSDPMAGASIGVDDDRDFIVDDGRVAIYRRLATDQLIGVIGDDVSEFDLGTPPGVVAGPRPRIQLRVTVERALLGAVRSAGDAAAVRAGGGPRVRHTADLWVVLNN